MRVNIKSWNISLNLWIAIVNQWIFRRALNIQDAVILKVDSYIIDYEPFLFFFFFFLQKLIGEVFNIVSQQSTARPGCIIELDAITNQVKTCLWIGDINMLYPKVLYRHMIHSWTLNVGIRGTDPSHYRKCTYNLTVGSPRPQFCICVSS